MSARLWSTDPEPTIAALPAAPSDAAEYVRMALDLLWATAALLGALAAFWATVWILFVVLSWMVG